ncbi:fumarylacetoacetate hydrolase family protein [Aquamicrobium zhengzhouense]|uniref:Fumarylacetoacetate hydrolase family protein n=1 Tax=Aquamicrobium zhengzhouense TaxID=2781738 RepID=A0ABS0SHF4_9HYPH|nr:fumarylacetoacetate hydrolase family protein [Aquamicrobium zhengzhouense]MBI1622740.1 fumarylacetoacetate hydrolase family protein [Aquamicrobium zhengzhouense]
MKLGTINHNGRRELIAAYGDDKAVLLRPLLADAGLPDAGLSLNDFIDAGAAAMDAARAILARTDLPQAAVLAVEGLDWLPPQPRPSKILGVAFNNMGIRNAAFHDPGVPNFFLKAPSSLTGHGKPIVIRKDYGETIPELELAGVIGKRLKEATVEEAREAIFGFGIINDITSHGLKFQLDSISTARSADLLRPFHLAWRRQHGEEDRDVHYVYHARSKASDTFGPMAPWLTTADEVENPNNLAVTGWYNGEVFAQDSTSNYRFKVEEVVAEASRYFTLEPGDMFCFGTSARGNEKFPHGHRSVNLHEMQGEVAIEIAGLGRLSNPVILE